MFISRKKYMELLHRVNALERKTEVQTFDFGATDLKKLCRELPGFVDKRIAAALDNRYMSMGE